MLRRKNAEWISMSTAELAARATPFERNHMVRNTDTGEVREGPGFWPEMAPADTLADLVVRTVSTTNITIATALNAGDTVNGVVLEAGDQVLVIGQTAKAENGVYTAGVSPARSTGYTTYDAHLEKLIRVEEGNSAGNLYRCSSAAGGTLGDTDLEFVKVIAGDLEKSALSQVNGLPAAPTLDGAMLMVLEDPATGLLHKVSLTTLHTFFTT